MRLFAVLGLAPALLALAGACGGDSAGPARTTPTALEPTASATVAQPTPPYSGQVGAGAIWGFLEAIEAQLIECQGGVECVTAIMRANGAPQDAITFFAQTGWFVTSYNELGVVDVVQVYMPWRANSNFDWALVNSRPLIVFGENVGKDLEPDASDPDYVALLATYPPLVIWPTDERFESMDTVAEGQSFVFQYGLNDGCHACRTGYRWRVALNFSADGTYETAQLLDICLTEGGTPAPDTDIGACPDAS